MKRVWFAVVFIALCAGLCVFEQIYVQKSCTELINLIEQAQELEEAKQSDKRDRKIDEIQEYWKQKNNFLFTFSEHETLDDLALNIRSLKEAHNMKSELSQTKTLVIIYYENERITLANVF